MARAEVETLRRSDLSQTDALVQEIWDYSLGEYGFLSHSDETRANKLRKVIRWEDGWVILRAGPERPPLPVWHCYSSESSGDLGCNSCFVLECL
jgi:hypothetical protein